MEIKLANHLSSLDSRRGDYKQKQLELYQIGKFLASYFPNYGIKEVTEAPDFIITNGEFGLEYAEIINPVIKK